METTMYGEPSQVKQALNDILNQRFGRRLGTATTCQLTEALAELRHRVQASHKPSSHSPYFSKTSQSSLVG